MSTVTATVKAFRLDTGKTVLFAGTTAATTDYTATGSVTATLVAGNDVLPSAPSAPVVTPVPEESQPPVPPAYQPVGYQQPITFNYLMLPRLATQPSKTLVNTVPRTVFKVSGVDYSDCFLDGDYLQPLHGTSGGKVTLGSVPGYNINPRATDTVFKRGALVEWRQQYATEDRLVAKCYIIQVPVYNRGQGNQATLELTLGDIFQLRDTENNLKSTLFCGPDAATSGQAAQLLCNRLQIPGSFPAGNALLEPVNNFYDEQPWEYLEKLYNPVDYDVRTVETGNIVVARRPSFKLSGALRLTADNCIEIKVNQSNLEPFSRVTANCKFSKNNGYPQEFKSYTVFSDNYNLSNRTPWFLNGPTKTEHDVQYLSGTEVFHTERLYGYYPTAPKKKSAANEDECEPNSDGGYTSGNTQFGLITTKKTWLQYQQHSSGAYLVTARFSRTSGKQAFETKDVDGDQQYEIVDTKLEYIQEYYDNSPQPDPAVCPRNYIVLQTGYTKIHQKLIAKGNFSTVDYLKKTYNLVNNSTVSTGTTSANNREWRVSEITGGYQEAKSAITGTYGRVAYKPEKVSNSKPPESEWIRAAVVDVELSKTVELPELVARYGRRESKPLDAPMSYTVNNLSLWATRWLREQAGLAESLVLVVPFSTQVSLGQSISYTDTDGTVVNGIVWSLELNQTGNQATRTVTILRDFTG